MKTLRASRPGAQRGAAALIVVLLLFFVISLVAAYAGRNLIFEQKTSTNQYRATQAFEAAEAGLEWALAMLNDGRITAGCVPPSPMDVTQRSFRQRYLTIDDTTGNITPVRWADGTTAERPSCVRHANDPLDPNKNPWACSCPQGVAPTPALPADGGVRPAFRVCFEAVDPPQPGVVRVVSTGRTRFTDEPCDVRGEGTADDASATVSVVVALGTALATPPSVALTVRGDLSVDDPMRLSPTPSSWWDILQFRRDWMPSGWLAQIGGTAATDDLLPSDVRGTPIKALVAVDPALGSLTAEQMFTSMFRMRHSTYKTQPAAVVLEDCAVACKDKLLTAWQANPGHILWVEGDMTIESDVNLGSAGNPLDPLDPPDPVLIVATGNIRLAASAAVNIVGLLYSKAADWDNGGPSSAEVLGAAVAEGNFVGRDIGGGAPWVQYNEAILRRLQLSTGSFVRVPGSWRDFQ
jgi:hypothetical protein